MNTEIFAAIFVTVAICAGIAVLGCWLADYVLPNIPFIERWISNLENEEVENGMIHDKKRRNHH